ncbi:NAD(P)H-binding protein [Helicobacter saguini]|uniref:NAD(P)H-binding protein n=1 Tax=Helicobacter saguini TaxID=1548018 RepID=A0A347VQQ4_9HELI|nr:NAD(P)H-binding protein [Helicobacter saguini]MWV63201.1 NAD(P)H-binding protein [Helicobacter saguini]MWV66129.1 NAD(P)H-binding protein [Helicobacter saguini]MWV68479.1 NAD(P)H-binding protein [Helicobacter saguini]MWV71967.1 NAD(P)H-binding protein [Helicobacter saguini]TLD95974.1 hypothetical protein LS64_001030 [Helicobacter saguini]
MLFFGVLNVTNAKDSNIVRASDFSEFKGKGANTTILIIGANGSVARVLEDALLESSDVKLKLFLRNASRLSNLQNKYPNRVELIEGDARDKATLTRAMKGANIAYANLDGDLPTMASAIIDSMRESGLKRLIWISSFGVYDEIPKSEINRIKAYLPPHIGG